MAQDMETDHCKDLPHVQVKLTSNSTRFSAPDAPFSVPVNLDHDALSQMLNQLLTEGDPSWEATEFDFLVEGELLRQTLQEHIRRQKLSIENVIYIECILRTPPPAPDGSYHHDNWVGAVHCSSDCYLTGCYDDKVRLWSSNGDLLQSLEAHGGPVKAVKWVDCGERSERGREFLSGSQDQYIHIWKWNQDSGVVELCGVCKGHARSVEGLSVSPNGTRFASVSWDKMLKVWSLTGCEAEEADQEGHSKRRRLQGKATTRTPLVTLSGHTQPVTGVVWPSAGEVVTCGWDHCIRLWDIEACSNKSSLTGSKVFHSIDVDRSKALVASASSDPYVRVWDAREKEGVVVKMTLAPHGGWVRAVQWSQDKQEQLVSASYDRLLKLWDTRSPRVPLYTMAAHEDKILCLDWSLLAVLASGGADGVLRTHSMG